MKLEGDWREILSEELRCPYIFDIEKTVSQERKKGIEVYPPDDQIFSAFHLTPYSKVRVVIVGQDPYHGPGQAHGLSFSVCKGIPLPPSLKNIYKELSSDLGVPAPLEGNLEPWARQGVLLLNASLSVRRGQANSHSRIGWMQFTDAVIAAVARKEEPVVFILWGNFAQKKYFKCRDLNTESRHLVIRSAHPSPLSAHNGFFGSRPFSQTNAFLESHQLDPIHWVPS